MMYLSSTRCDQIADDLAEQNKVAISWMLKATHEKDFADFPATHKKFETQGTSIFNFEGDKIKEAWTVCDMAVLAQRFKGSNLLSLFILGLTF
jgi:predicted ester cyclase